MRIRSLLFVSGLCLGILVPAISGQTITASLEGRILDPMGAPLSGAKITAVNTDTGLSRSTVAGSSGIYALVHLPAGTYQVSVEAANFQPAVVTVRLAVGRIVGQDFSLALNGDTVALELLPAGRSRTATDSIIAQKQLRDLPVNGRRLLDLALLAPGVTLGNTAGDHTDTVTEPATALSFSGQNLHYNFVALDGADNTSTASALSRAIPSQEAVAEFAVVDNNYSAASGRAVGGAVNIVTTSGTNRFHGSAYEFFGNDALDASAPLAAGFDKLRYNQFGVSLGGPIRKDRTFFFGDYEGQQRRDNPHYNSVILADLAAINSFKFGMGLAPEQLNVTRNNDYDQFLLRLDHSFTASESFFLRYFFNDSRLTNVSPLDDGTDLPSAFKDNSLRDHSLAGALTSVFTPHLVNEVRAQYAHRAFDFTADTTQPHLNVLNTFASGAGQGQPESYEESREEFADHLTWTLGRHALGFGGDFSHVDTLESFPIYYPFEADFGCVLATTCPFSLQAGAPEFIFFERFAAPTFTEPAFSPTVFQGRRISTTVRDQAQGDTGHTYGGLYVQDHWRATDHLVLDFGLRYQFETFPSVALNNQSEVDPRAGFAYDFGTRYHLVLRGGAGTFHGTIPMSLLACQQPSCGGTAGSFPRINGDALNATTRLFTFASAPNITSIALSDMLGGTYPDAAPLGFCPGGVVAGCGFFGDSVLTRFDKNFKAPYGIQTTFGLGLEPFHDASLDIVFMRSKGVHLGSFYNVNQPDSTGTASVHDSRGDIGPKNTYFAAPGIPGARSAAPGFPVLYSVFLEAASRWNSEWDGLLVSFNKRTSHHFSLGASYTWSKGIDDGPDPTFALVPQDTLNLRAERSVSSDNVGQRFVVNAIIDGPTHVHPVLNNFHLGTIISAQSPHYFTKFAGFDANGDILTANDRVGIEPRNTFKGDTYQSVDLRLSRRFQPSERLAVDAIAETFNLLNTTNVRLLNTVYGAADFCPFNPAAQGCSATQRFLEGSPNPDYGTPRSVYNPRQFQLALRLTF